MQKKLFLLDAYALIYRSYYAFIKNPRYNSKGMNTSAILGFTNTLAEVLEKQKPSHIAVAFDPEGPTFRHEMFKEYKAHREEMPEDIRKSIPYIKEIVRAFNIPIIVEEGYEADDVIGTLAFEAQKEGYEVYMMTPDKDYGQLITDQVYMYKPKRSGNEAELIDKDKICEQFGIEKPEQVIDVLALWGDKSDNIPGAPGIGEKTAKKLIGKYGSIEKIYENIDDLKGKQKENLINYKDQVLISKKLVTIDINVPTEFKGLELDVERANEKKLKDLFEELEFKNLANRILNIDISQEPKGGAVQQSIFGNFESGKEDSAEEKKEKGQKKEKKKYLLVDKEKDINSLVRKLTKQKEFCFDTETTGLNPHTSELVGISVAFKKHEAYYIPFPEDQESAQKLAEKIKKPFEEEKIVKIGQNLKYDIIVLKQYGIKIKGALFDTMIAHYLIQPEHRHNLDFMAEKYLNHTPIDIETLIGKKGKNQSSMRSVPVEKITPYACEDADLTYLLKDILEKKLKENHLWELASKMEMPLIHVLIEMECQGVKIDQQALKDYAKELKKELAAIEKKIFEMSGVEFNVGSPKQLGEVLFDRMKIVDKPKRTKTKQYSTSEETLMQMRDKHPIIEKILEFRSVKKLLTAYVESLPELINPKTGKIHTSFNQAIAATGRLSSNNPNLQNIPIREERGKRIREAFIPSDKEHILFAADYSQIELRLMAHMSNDPNMIEAFRNNEDIHTSTAAKIFHLKTLDEVTKDQRRKAKTANFGIIYGISAFGLSQRLGIPRREAKELIDEYFHNFPQVKEYMDHQIEIARERGYVETIKGRKRFLENINSRNATVRGMDERNAINAPIQGSAADIIKIAMRDIHETLGKESFQSKMILQVHDELIFETYKPELEALSSMVTEKMGKAYSLKVPLIVDTGYGTNWLEAH